MDLSHPLEQISERGLLPKRPFPGPADLPLVGGAFYFGRLAHVAYRFPTVEPRPAWLPFATTLIPPSPRPPSSSRHTNLAEGPMTDLFNLAMPWWEFILRAVVVYTVVLGMVRLSGKRALGQITPFDVLLIVLLGNAVQNALLGQDTSLGGGLLLAATLILLNYGVGWLTTRSTRIEKLVEGEPVLIARDGQLLPSVLKRELVTPADVEAAMRQQGCLRIEDVALALLENNGHITILPKSTDDQRKK